jgi:hypothetical protein
MQRTNVKMSIEPTDHFLLVFIPECLFPILTIIFAPATIRLPISSASKETIPPSRVPEQASSV